MISNIQIEQMAGIQSKKITVSPDGDIITGRNGSGKTMLLDLLWWFWSRSWAHTPIQAPFHLKFSLGKYSQENEMEFDRETQGCKQTIRDSSTPDLIIYVRDDGISVLDAHRTGPDLTQAHHFNGTDIWNGKQWHGTSHCNGLISDWVRWELEGKSKDWYTAHHETLEAVFSALFKPLKSVKMAEYVRVPFDARWHPAIDCNGTSIPLVHASAGIRRMAELAYTLVWTWTEHCEMVAFKGLSPMCEDILLLIDDVDLHLGVEWQEGIVQGIYDALKVLTGKHVVRTQILMTTHSKTIIQSHRHSHIDLSR